MTPAEGQAGAWVLAMGYLQAKRFVILSGFGGEISWQARQIRRRVSERALLAEAAWVILSAGLAERIIRRKFPAISRAFRGFRSAGEIARNARSCLGGALVHFRHPGKLRAIIHFARMVDKLGCTAVLEAVRGDPLGFCMRQPYLGPVSVYHLAKNLGLDVAKPDRHLCRLSRRAGYQDVQTFCRVIAEYTGDSVPVVDLVLWRFATLKPLAYRILFRQADGTAAACR